MTPSQALAIQGDDSVDQDGLEGAEVLDKTGFKKVGIDVGKAVHSAEHCRGDHEEDLAEMVALVSSGAGGLNDFE